jgi:hypothetical protein
LAECAKKLEKKMFQLNAFIIDAPFFNFHFRLLKAAKMFPSFLVFGQMRFGKKGKNGGD